MVIYLRTINCKWKHFINFTGIEINENSGELPIKPVPFISLNISDRTVAESDNNKTYSLRWNPIYSQNQTVVNLTGNSFFYQDATMQPDSKVEFQVS